MGKQKAEPAQAKSTEESEVAALEKLIAEERERQGVSNESVGKFKFSMQTLPPLTAEQERQIQVERDAIDSVERKRRRQRRVCEFLESVGELHSVCRLANYETKGAKQEKVLATVKEYADTMQERVDNRERLVLFGPCGTGKDHLAVALGGIAVERHDLQVRLVNGQDWLGEVRDGMSEDLSEKSILREVLWPDILILSDPLPPFGNLGQHMAAMLYRVINTRDSRGKVTWVTINIADSKEAKERLGVPTWDRICDRAWVIHCNWPSHRKPARSI